MKLVLHALHENELPFINGGEPVHVPEISSLLSLGVIIVTLVVTGGRQPVASRTRRTRSRSGPARCGRRTRPGDGIASTDGCPRVSERRIALSVLDLVPVRSDQTTADALAATLALARTADELGYRATGWPSTTTCRPSRRPTRRC